MTYLSSYFSFNILRPFFEGKTPCTTQLLCLLIISQLNIFLLLTITVAFSFRVTFDHSSALQLTIAFWIRLVLL